MFPYGAPRPRPLRNNGGAPPMILYSPPPPYGGIGYGPFGGPIHLPPPYAAALPYPPYYGGPAGFGNTAPMHAVHAVQGVDFDAARAHGVSSAAFGAKLAEILTSAPRGAGDVELTWVAFGGAYDLAYLVKMLDGGQPLPETRQGFVARVRELLGGRVFDAKFMAENCGRADLRGVGLRSVAANLGAAMPVEDLPWLAGTKSVTAYRIHTILRFYVLSQDTAAGFEGIIDGLQ
ncbi:unnamed protein product [Miscanthus lutarioriparius]|uniref:Uncharacterized protein n=1 Tax=Miscanthus lutarioriparius TaxID=422564 RepID=A0A811SMS8_9POAL|nr:unnamed protein product [Miscanthus lutarioriparius]